MLSWDKLWEIADKGATLGFCLVPAITAIYSVYKKSNEPISNRYPGYHT